MAKILVAERLTSTKPAQKLIVEALVPELADIAAIPGSNAGTRLRTLIRYTFVNCLSKLLCFRIQCCHFSRIIQLGEVFGGVCVCLLRTGTIRNVKIFCAGERGSE